MKRKLYVAVLGMSLLTACSIPKADAPEWFENAVKTSNSQLLYMAEKLKDVPDTACFPRSTKPDGSYRLENGKDWTSGFYPGSMWLAYELTGDEALAEEARKYTNRLEDIQYYTGNHDIGFMMYCSYGQALRLKPEPKDKQILINSSESLCARFSPEVGLIRSWDFGDWSYPVIIDNMMNLELLYFATRVTGDSLFAKVANKHAETTARNHFRDDYSSYHVVNYDEETGEVLHRATCQGFSDNSTWARGQAWAIYGYTMAYRETKKTDFLNMAVHIADFWLNHPRLPEDGIPYWDFDAGQRGYVPDWNYDPQRFTIIPRDASAAAIAASAFLELSEYVTEGKKYVEAAEHILQSLSSSDYLAEPGTNCNFILRHSVGSIPHGVEIDVPLVYADYYYLEALTRYKNKRYSIGSSRKI